jgi:hypothetical protein
MHMLYRQTRRALRAVILPACLLVPAVFAAESVRESVNITYRIPEGVYINAGRSIGLGKGVSGTLVLEGGRTLAFDVVQAAQHTALLRLQGGGEALTGRLPTRPVELLFTPVSVSGDQPDAPAASAGSDDAFVPLLAAPERMAEAAPAKNLSRGHIGIQHTWQEGTENQLDYALSRIYSSGSIDRLFGTGWGLDWSGNIRYRSGDGYAYHDFYEKPQLLVYSAHARHRLAGEGFGRLGRFLPLELPGIGYIDGGQLEVDPGGRWRFGAVAGLKPERVSLDVSVDEPTAVGYATFEAGGIDTAYYSGTAGILGALYKGEADRLAVLFDQRAGLGPRLDLLSTMEYDFGVADTTNSQSRLTRLDVQVSSRLHGLLTLRAGADHWRRADTRANRDLLPFVLNDELFDDGYWRYWVGGRHELPWGLDLNEEVSHIVSDATDDAVRWRIGLIRTGLFGWQFAHIGATVYNLEAQDAAGYGGLLQAYLPMWNNRLSLRPALSSRWLDPDNGGDGLSVTYVALHGDWVIHESWILTGGITSTRGDGADSILADTGLRYSW